MKSRILYFFSVFLVFFLAQEPQEDPWNLFLSTELLKKSELGLPKSDDLFEQAVFLTQIFHFLSIEDSRFHFPSIIYTSQKKETEILNSLLKKLDVQLRTIGSDPEEFFMLLNFSQSPLPSVQSAKTLTSPRGIELNHMTLSTEQNSSSQSFQTLVSFAYHGIKKLETLVELSAQNKVTDQNNQSQIFLHQAKAQWTPPVLADKILFGKYEDFLGNGISAPTSLNGFEINGSYRDHLWKVGWRNGLFGSFSSPVFMDTPLQFFLFHPDQSQDWLSGLTFDRNFGKIRLVSELAEYQNPQKNLSDSQVFSMKMDLPVRNFSFQSALSHTGENFRSIHELSSSEEDPSDTQNGFGVQKEVLSSLSNYFRKPVFSLPGFSSLNFGFSYKHKSQWKLDFEQNLVYDHTRMDRNYNDQFFLSSLRYSQNLNEQTLLSFSLRGLFWKWEGEGDTTMGRFQKQNDTQIASSLSMRF